MVSVAKILSLSIFLIKFILLLFVNSLVSYSPIDVALIAREFVILLTLVLASNLTGIMHSHENAITKKCCTTLRNSRGFPVWTIKRWVPLSRALHHGGTHQNILSLFLTQFSPFLLYYYYYFIIIGSIPKAWRCLHSPKYAPSNQQTKAQITNNNKY